MNLGKRHPAQAIKHRSDSRVFERVGQRIAPKFAFGTHSMLKTRGYAMHSVGRSIESIAKVLNHFSPAVMTRYICMVQQDIDDSYNDFEC